jgi:transposase
MLGLVKSQPDLTLAELRERIRSDKGVSMSSGLVHLWVRRLGPRLKKVAPRGRTRQRSQPYPARRVPPAHPLDRSEETRLP